MKTILIVLTFITAVFAIVVIRNEMIAKEEERLLKGLTWDEHTKIKFISDCENLSPETNPNLPGEKITAYCNCMYDKVSKKYSPKDYYAANPDSLAKMSELCKAEMGIK